MVRRHEVSLERLVDGGRGISLMRNTWMFGSCVTSCERRRSPHHGEKDPSLKTAYKLANQKGGTEKALSLGTNKLEIGGQNRKHILTIST